MRIPEMLGQIILHYEILEKLGEGGMGVVYRALDTRLRRTVAIKLLRDELLPHLERKQRFMQEARAASALNHPNIITIFEIGTADWQAQPLEFIAMEFVAGSALDSLIGRRGLPLEEVLRYGAQIAGALATAHEAGIVHRDIKPANIMIADATSGIPQHVKVLDFGLAKLAEPARSDGPTLTETMGFSEALLTEEGVIMGTVSYMSPEQAQGKKVDARSDIFSFGSVLYEMVTGRRPFEDESKIGILSAILHKEPSSIGELPAAASDLEKIIFRCLRKDPDRRFQHMIDVKVALEEVSDALISHRHTTAQGSPTAPRRSHAAAVVPVSLILLAAVVGGALWLGRSPPQKELKLTRLTSDSGLTTDPAISADGKMVAYASDRGGDGNLDIWVQQIGSKEALRLTRDEADDSEPDFSPDGRTIAFHSERDGGGIYVVSTLGGDHRRITERGRRPRFSPDGKWIAYYTRGDDFSPGASKVFLVASTGGPSRDPQPEFLATRHPVWSPNGSHLLFYGLREYAHPAQDTGDWWVAPMSGGPNEVVKTGARARFRRQNLNVQMPGVWLPGERIVFSAARGDTRNLWQVVMSSKSWQIASDAERLTFGTGLEDIPSGAGARLVFASLTGNIDIWSVSLHPNRGADQGKVSGSMQKLTQDAFPDTHPALSSDGTKLVFRSNRSGSWQIWMKDLQTGKETGLTAPPEIKGSPILSKDGSKLAYNVVAQQNEPVYVMALGAGTKAGAGAGAIRKVCEDCFVPWDWSSDERYLLYWAGKQRVIGLLDLATGEKKDLLQHPEYALLRARFSPDNRWISFMGISRGFFRLFIAPFNGPAAPSQNEWVAVTENAAMGNVARWSPDGNLLYFTSDEDGFRCIWAQRLDLKKKPVGPAFEVYPLHSAVRSMMDVPVQMLEISIAPNRLVFPLSERTGSIWLAEP
jgi:eukaryotic-like serine/threonine-protein kinase